MELPDETIDELLALGAIPLAHERLEHALAAICTAASRAVRNADGATLTTFTSGGPETSAASDDWAEELDEMQFVEHEGPCVDAGRTGVLFRVRDIDREVRWPAYMPRAREMGARSMVSLPMTVEAKVIGALNVYSRQTDAFGAEEVSVAEVIAGHASLAAQVAAALQGHRNVADQLHDAMGSRATIEQAKGIIMATTGCGPDDAFRQLQVQSQHENVKVRQLAEELVRRAARGSTPPT